MDPEINARLERLEAKVDSILRSVERTRKYFLWTLIVTIAIVVLPAIGLFFVLPSFVSNYTEVLQGLQ